MGRSQCCRLPLIIARHHLSSFTLSHSFTRFLPSSIPLMQSARKMGDEPLMLFDVMGVKGKYKFSIGAPGPKDLKKVAALMEKVTAQRMREELATEGASLLQYGHPVGDPRSIRALANFLTAEYGEHVNESHLTYTSGATAGLTHLTSLMFPKKCQVYAEALTYHVALAMLRDFGFPIKSVPVEMNGIDMDGLAGIWARDLKEISIEEQKTTPYQAMLYTIPTFQNPTGTIMSPEKCERLISLARKYHVLVLSEDVYNMFYYDGSSKPPKRLFSYDNESDKDYGVGHVVSNCTFSKLLSPGLRLGWQELPEAMKDKYYTKSSVMISGGGLNPVIGGSVTIALEDGTASKMIAEFRAEHTRKMQMAIKTLNECMPPSCKLLYAPKGGYFLFIELPKQLDATQFAQYVREKLGMNVVDGVKFASSSEDFVKKMSNGLRIAIPYPTFEVLQEGLHHLCDALKEKLN